MDCREPPRLSLVEFNKQTKKEIKDERNLKVFSLQTRFNMKVGNLKDRRQPTNDCCQKANNAKLQKFYQNQMEHAKSQQCARDSVALKNEN